MRSVLSLVHDDRFQSDSSSFFVSSFSKAHQNLLVHFKQNLLAAGNILEGIAEFIAKMATSSIPAAPVPSSTSTNCKLCGGYYRDPHLLHCLHTFCKSCLDSVVKKMKRKILVHLSQGQSTSHALFTSTRTSPDQLIINQLNTHDFLIL